jgi:hypothetical protein
MANYLTVNENYSSFNTPLAKSEKNDCFVRALAIAADVNYTAAHNVAKEVFGRPDKKGTCGVLITAVLLRAEEAGLQIGRKHVKMSLLGKKDLKNKYKVKGDIIWRQKTLKSFMQSHPKGSFVVTVANHAVAVINGELEDWSSNAFQPTRKVLSAYKIEPITKVTQLRLFE